MNQPDPKPMSVEERVARHLATKDWLTTEDHWDQGSASFRADYLAHAREVLAIVRTAEPAAQPPADRTADNRQPAYDAVFAYIRQQPRDFLPTTIVDRNAMIWRAVHAALDATIPAVRAEALREAADFVGNDDDCGCGGCDTCVPRKLADELRRLAGEQPTPECAASISGNCLAEAQSETVCDTDDGECVHGGRPGGEQPVPVEAFVPLAAMGLPAGTLEAAEIGASALDAWARTPNGRNFLAHALVQLARVGWLRTEPGEGFEPVRDRDDVPEPLDPTAPQSA